MLTLKQAARQVGMSRSSMHRAVQRGQVSATRAENGMLWIDESELARAFPPSQPSQVGPSQDVPLGSSGKGPGQVGTSNGQGEHPPGQVQAAALERVINE